MLLLSQKNVFKRHLLYPQVCGVTYNYWCRVTLISFVSEQRKKLTLHNNAHVTEFTEAMSKFSRGTRKTGNKQEEIEIVFPSDKKRQQKCIFGSLDNAIPTFCFIIGEDV